MRLGGIAAAEDRPGPLVDESDLVVTVVPAAEIGAAAIVAQRKDAAADRDPRLASMAGLLPGGAVRPDLGGLLHMKGLASFVVLERGALQVHSEFCRPDRRGVRAGTPPDALAQAVGIWVEAQQAGRIWKHGSWIRLGETLTAQQVEEDLRMTPAHVGVILALGRLIAEISPAIDHLLGRASTDAELKPTASDQIGCAGILGHVERILVAHVDHRRADLDPAGLRTDRSQQREWRGELAGGGEGPGKSPLR